MKVSRLLGMWTGLGLVALLMIWSEPVLCEEDMEDGRPRQTMQQYEQYASDRAEAEEYTGKWTDDDYQTEIRNDMQAGRPVSESAPELSHESSVSMDRGRAASTHNQGSSLGAGQSGPRPVRSTSPPCAG